MKKLVMVALAAVLCAPASWALSGSVGAFGSYWKTKDEDAGFGGGVKAAVGLIKNLSVEARAAYFGDVSEGFDLKVTPLELGLTYAFPVNEKFTPYIGAGAGYFMLDGSSDQYGDLEFDNQMGFYGLGGLEYEFAKSWALLAEITYTSVKTGDYSQTGGHHDFPSEKLDGLGANLGVLWTW